MNRRLIVADQAEADVELIARMIGDVRPSAGRRFISEIEMSFDLISTFPEIGGAWKTNKSKLEGMRSFCVPRFKKYVIFYRLDPDGVRIYRVLHGARGNMENLLVTDIN